MVAQARGPKILEAFSTGGRLTGRRKSILMRASSEQEGIADLPGVCLHGRSEALSALV